MRVLIDFLRDDSGAVTIDWVTLTAGVLVAGLVAIFVIYGGGVSALVSETNERANAHYQNVDPGTPNNLNGLGQ